MNENDGTENKAAQKPLKPGLLPLIVVAVVVIAAIGGIFAYNEFLKPEPALVTATVSVDFGNETVLSEVISSDNNTALGLLQAFVGKENVQASDFGYVTSINGHQETGDMFWLYYVNGEMSLESAASIEIRDGDLVEFRFEPSPWR